MTEQELGEQWRKMAAAERNRINKWSGFSVIRNPKKMTIQNRNDEVFAAIRKRPGLTCNDLSALLDMKETTMRSTIDRLQREGKIAPESVLIRKNKTRKRCNVWFPVD